MNTALRPVRKLLSETGISLTVCFVLKMGAFVLAVILNMHKVDRSQPAVPVNTSLLGLYETASSLELKTDPWILFLYGPSCLGCLLSTHRGASVVAYSSTASIEEMPQ